MTTPSSSNASAAKVPFPPMTFGKAALLRAFGSLYTAFFSVLISVVTAILVDGVVGLTVSAWRILKLNHQALIKLSSSVLRTWFSIFMGHLEHFGRLTIVLTGDAFHPNESALVVCNHRSWADTVVIYSLARQVRMHGDVKFLAKRSLLVFPVYGFAGWVLDVVIFIKRQSTSAGRRLNRMFSSLTDPRRRQAPYWLISYLEGTRFTHAKRQNAVEFAKKRDLKVLEEVLQPRTKGFISTVHALRTNAQAVYDITIGYTQSENGDMDPTFKQMYLTPARKDRVIHVHQRRIPLSDLPQDDEELKNWVYRLYEQKDELLKAFRTNGCFAARPMRWNRMTWGYWMQCQAIVYGAFGITIYTVYTLFSFAR
ncbi:putative 1-acyl-sn-glycerol-3-phosphate acyltransferase 5 [Gracilariopsis chorda]|uniref:Putative 1-acyl-sn-glycerol-3-phosphate acyltransferase 5 n=1 Tax=Gracilariopsis chorda TaxID=448386 RepID=A0A2V3ISU8_9FLOR|nr:putative 1-acyl-sn-glycerol-3-phosphate acyltransferase 5 [Gracilariopsis chorda]|eukprot:PXF45184.1 putative 1-acyl-sn-glycerol-3-phosphate acyltransferase 5 [Gracilariopsis chorda]